MFTLLIDKKSLKKPLIIYLFVTIFCAVFGFIYECCSHEVYSPYMALNFLYPLLFGCLVYFIFYAFNIKLFFGYLVEVLYNFSIATLTVGSIYKGIIDIYGTTNDLYYVYCYVGCIGFVISLILYIVGIIGFLIKRR